MKVICIDDDWTQTPGNSIPNTSPVLGEITTVSDAYKDVEGEWYEFVEHGDGVYEQSGFIPLSSIDETTFQRNYQKQTESCH